MLAPGFHRAVEDLERDLIAPLPDTEAEGVFGRTSGKRLRRLPSSVYGSGLHRWGIRSDAVSGTEYARNIAFCRRRSKRVRRTEVLVKLHDTRHELATILDALLRFTLVGATRDEALSHLSHWTYVPEGAVVRRAGRG